MNVCIKSNYSNLLPSGQNKVMSQGGGHLEINKGDSNFRSYLGAGEKSYELKSGIRVFN